MPRKAIFMNCPQCGIHQVVENAKFCNGCGATLSPSLPATMPATALRYPEAPPTGNVGEYRRTCLACGKVWHSLIAREQQVQQGIKSSNCDVITLCGNPAAQQQATRNLSAGQSEIARLRQCPNCNSSSYHEEIVAYQYPPQ